MVIAKKVWFNMAALYARVIVSAFLSFFASRYILAALGVHDFGLYSVIAGVMGFMAFLNGAMSTGTQRHLTHALGRGDLAEVNRFFKAAFFLHLALAGVVFVLGETVGLLFVEKVLNIPESRRDAAFWVYQFTIITTIGYIILVPYQALLTAHEALVAVSLIGVFQALAAFVLAFMLVSIPGDKLIVFVLLSSLIMLAAVFLQIFICRSRYPESKLMTENKLERRCFFELLGVSGWSLFGSLSVVCRFQGTAFLLNVFFGPLLNAAYGIANQVTAMMTAITQSMQQAIAPRLIKIDGAGNREQMLDWAMLMGKYGFFIAAFGVIPAFSEMPWLLSIWLKNPPEHAIFLCRVALVIFLVDQISSGCQVVVLSLGAVAKYNILVGMGNISTIPVMYLLFKANVPFDWVMGWRILTMIMVSLIRVHVVASLTSIALSSWLKKTLGKALFGIAPSVVAMILLNGMLPASFFKVVVVGLVMLMTWPVGIFFLGMAKIERERIREKFSSNRFLQKFLL